MITLSCLLPSLSLAQKRVLVRADCNVPLENGAITSDYRLTRLLPTLDFILEHKASLVLTTHIGNPTNQESSLSTHHLLSWFKKRGYNISFATTLEKLRENHSSFVLLENLRFFSGEKDNDPTFARILTNFADIYVNDAFGVMHRNDASIILAPSYFSPQTRTIGFLVQEELEALNLFLSYKSSEALYILGGAKVATKLPMIKKLVEQHATIYLCPPLVFTFMKALGITVGASLVDDTLIGEAQDIITFAKRQNSSLLFPLDYYVYTKNDRTLRATQPEHFSENDIGISIGSKSLHYLQQLIKSHKAIFLNGPMGFLDQPNTLTSSLNLFTMLQKAFGYTVLAGGDTIAVAQNYQCLNGISFVSTGGGATLTYLSTQQLPGLAPFLTQRA